MNTAQTFLVLSLIFVCRTSPIPTPVNDYKLEKWELVEDQSISDNSARNALSFRTKALSSTGQTTKAGARPTLLPTSSSTPCATPTTPSKTNVRERFRKWFKALKFLKKYHYLSSHVRGNHDMQTAIEIYQRYMNLPVSGRLDNATQVSMDEPRCGVPDLEIDDPGLGISKRFAVSDKRWLNTSLLYAFETYTADLTQTVQKAVIAKAFKMWSDVSPFIFTLTTDKTKAHIKILFGTNTHGNCLKAFDGPGKVIAHAYYPSDGRLHFDDDETFTDGVNTGTNLLAIAVHEIGHILGIAHSTDKNSVMYPKYETYKPNLQLHAEDINAIAYIYAGGTATPDTGISVCQDADPGCPINVSMCFTDPDAMKMTCPKTCQFCVSS
ncbi:matrilysin isoform X2 [Nematostella vectensis]|uniref:matrilysin isoform X2 n=1 Tax=Nematostella vectensis TaxID=45351 RepID=UPI0013906038|nr:matrilysin isoform X2 [Nematostella vectensis]